MILLVGLAPAYTGIGGEGGEEGRGEGAVTS